MHWFHFRNWLFIVFLFFIFPERTLAKVVVSLHFHNVAIISSTTTTQNLFETTTESKSRCFDSHIQNKKYLLEYSTVCFYLFVEMNNWSRIPTVEIITHWTVPTKYHWYSWEIQHLVHIGCLSCVHKIKTVCWQGSYVGWFCK